MQKKSYLWFFQIYTFIHHDMKNCGIIKEILSHKQVVNHAADFHGAFAGRNGNCEKCI